jgi:hypothetical protein
MQAALAEAEAALALQQGRCAELEAEVTRLGECNLNLNQELEAEVSRLGAALLAVRRLNLYETQNGAS